MMVSSSTFFLGFWISIVYSCVALSADSCIMNSLSIKHEQKEFADFVLMGRNLIFINLNFNHSNFDEFVEEKKLERWVWVANDYRYVLSYPEDVNVFSFGLLKAKQGSLEVDINIGNLTEACKSNFNSYLAQHISKVVHRNSSITINVLNTPEGYICHSKLEISWLKQKVSDFSAVKLGYPFWCYTDNNTTMVVEKSYVNYIVIFIIFFTYCFYPLAIESAFYIEDKKTVQGTYYMSESPYSPSVLCKRILFAGNNKYLATLRIIIFVTVLTSVIYRIKEYVYDNCNCILKTSNDNESFQHAENIYSNCLECVLVGILHFLVINICVLLNSNGVLDDFIICDFTNLVNGRMFLKTMEVAIFLSKNEKQKNQDEEQSDQTKHLVSLKIRKLSLILSLSFWSKIFFIHRVNQYKKCKCFNVFYKIIRYVQPMICFPINICLVLSSTFCPLVSNVYVLFVKRLNCFRKCIDIGVNEQNEITGFVDRSAELQHNDNEEEMKGGENGKNGCLEMNTNCCINKICLVFNIIYHIIIIALLTFTYWKSFNIFFYGMSYVIQYFIFTLFLAVPHFPIQSYIYIIFFTSVIIYMSRFVYQFIKLYKSLLEKILEIQEQNSIPIKHFDKVVSKHFPLSNEIFYLFVKIMFSGLFFAIIFDTMQNVGYIRFGAQPDLTTIISLIFLFGPPRIIEAFLSTDFTSRVHRKEKEIKEELDRIKARNDNDDKTIENKFQKVLTDKEKKLSCIRRLSNCLDLVKPDDSKTLSKNKPKLLREECCKFLSCCCKYHSKLFFLRSLCMFCCGCCNCPFDDNGHCECCAIMKESKSGNIKLTWFTISCACIEDEERKESEETEETELKKPLFKAFEDTDTKIPFETDDEDKLKTLAHKLMKTDKEETENTEPKEFTTEVNEIIKTENKNGEDTGTLDKHGVELFDIDPLFPSNENVDQSISSGEEETHL